MQINPRALAHDFLTNLNPRELFYWSVGNGVYWAFRLGMRVELYGMHEHFCPPAPATLIIGAHKRDWDPMLFAAFSHYPHGWLAPDIRRTAFTARSDMWEPGFLATVVGYKGWPLWVQYLLDHTSFAPIATLMRAKPILRVPEYTLRQYLRSVLHEEGDLPLDQVLSARALALFAQGQQARSGRTASFPTGRSGAERAALPDALTMSKALGWAYRPLTSRSIRAHMLLPGRYERLREAWRAQVEQEMETLARVLDSGDTLWFAPEGAVSLDGRLLRLRSGLHTLLARARPDARCLPVNISYDFMTSERRMLVCMGVGPALEGLRGLEQSELAARVAPAMVRQTVVTMSQLGSARLMEQLSEQCLEFDPQAEAPRIAAHARRLADLGAWVQRDLLTEHGLRRRLRAFLSFCQKRRLLLPEKNGGYHIAVEAILGTRSSTFWENPARYCTNELTALEEALQPAATSGGDGQAAAPMQAAESYQARQDEAN
jgi:1-acyl-sn-glycerol-3-phosphate acyltransferase